MATSGTVGLTRINTAKVLEKAIRRCGKSPQSLTPETVETAKEDLFILLLSLSTRGLNLWCVDKQLMGLKEAQSMYVLPVGTQAVLNLLLSSHTRAEGTDSEAVGYYQTALEQEARVVRFGLTFSVAPTEAFLFESSSDGVTWTTHLTISELPMTGKWYWYDLDPSVQDLYFRVSSVTLTGVSDFFLSTANQELSLSAYNRDDYTNQPNKLSLSDTPVSYFFEKLVDPRITLWPVPANDEKCLVLYRYRQVQDIGSLTQELEIPSRWLEPITWQLALRLAFELPDVDPARRAEVIQMAGSMTMEVENSETDNSPVYYTPNIGVYTR